MMSNSRAETVLFADTSRKEISAALDFLHDLIDAIFNLYLNGRKPEFGTRDYTEYNQRVRNNVAAALNDKKAGLK